METSHLDQSMPGTYASRAHNVQPTGLNGQAPRSQSHQESTNSGLGCRMLPQNAAVSNPPNRWESLLGTGGHLHSVRIEEQEQRFTTGRSPAPWGGVGPGGAGGREQPPPEGGVEAPPSEPSSALRAPGRSSGAPATGEFTTASRGRGNGPTGVLALFISRVGRR